MIVHLAVLPFPCNPRQIASLGFFFLVASLYLQKELLVIQLRQSEHTAWCEMVAAYPYRLLRRQGGLTRSVIESTRSLTPDMSSQARRLANGVHIRATTQYSQRMNQVLRNECNNFDTGSSVYSASLPTAARLITSLPLRRGRPFSSSSREQRGHSPIRSSDSPRAV